MKYISTRGNAPELGFENVLLEGLAKDGGLYIPEIWPSVDYKNLPEGPYFEQAAFIIHPFVDDFVSKEELLSLTERAYSQFPLDDAAPLKEIQKDNYLLELYHGPTLAFKDFAMLLLAEFFNFSLKKRNKKITILGATSGDTGSAAIEAFKDSEHANVFILFPEGRVSDIQRKQMTTVSSQSVYPIEVNGNFDDCQNLVKNLFQDLEFKNQYSLAAINSINWARVAAQIVYYFTSFQKIDAEKVSFSVPTGNFGDIFAGWVAKKMGLPIDRLIVATNSNDILHRAISTGDYFQEKVQATISPSMDIQISSNFERLLFESLGRNSKETASLIEKLKNEKGFTINQSSLEFIRNDFDSGNANEDQIRNTIRLIYNDTGIIIDPHTAVGFFVSKDKLNKSFPMINLGTADPSKFPNAVKDSISIEPNIPNKLDKILKKDEKFDKLEDDPDALKSYIMSKVK